jgi:hypothetical protein
MDFEKDGTLPAEKQFLEDAGLGELLPWELKKEARKEWHWFLWLSQKTYAEITKITGFHRDTVRKDIEEAQAELSKHPIDYEGIRQLALAQLRFVRAEIIHAARDAKSEHAKAKLYGEAAGILEKILDRFTQPTTINQQAVKPEMDRARALIEYMIEKYGPDSLDGFEEWYTKWKVDKAEY